MKLTLNEAWEKTEAMWKWIDAKSSDPANVRRLKRRWLHENDPEIELEEDCYFCEYDVQNEGDDICLCCPGRLVDTTFHCENEPYHYLYNPKACYAEIVELNQIRLEKEQGNVNGR